MKVQFDLVGHDTSPETGIKKQIVVNLSTIPQMDDIINWPGLSQADTYVRTIVWYISHDDDGEPLEEPFVYVVVGRSRLDPGRHNAFEKYLKGGQDITVDDKKG